MRIEVMPGETNVVRFPVERRARPTIGRLRHIAPDIREVLAIAEAYDLDPPMHDLRDRVDASTAEYIANQLPDAGSARAAMLSDMLDGPVVAAVAACHAAHDAACVAADVQLRLDGASGIAHGWVNTLREQADRLGLRAAELMLTAHVRAEEAEGVARAVGQARSSTPWTARSVAADMKFLMTAHRAG
jgi:hypothetical protein